MKKINLIMGLIVFTNIISAQNIGIGTTTPNASAILEIKASNKGLLIPRTSTTSRTAIINPAKGLMVYDTTTSSFWFYNSSAWVQIGTGGNGWALTGNAGTNPAANFIGTTDAQPLMFKVNDEKSGSIDYNASKANTAFGYKSLFSNTGNYNTASGYAALYSNTSGYSNVAIGIRALFSNTIQRHVVAIGDSALFNNGINAVNSFHAERNTAVGSKALYANTNGYSNTAIGYLTLFSNTTGIRNTAIGAWSLYYNSTGSYNTAVGESLVSNTTGSNNTASGTWSLYENTTGRHNSASGYGSMFFNTTGQYNSAHGNESLYSNTTGFSNVGVGIRALFNNTVRSNLVAIGDSALFNNGLGAMEPNHASVNTAVGSKALYSNATGRRNTASGYNSMYGNISGEGNTANGGESLYFSTSGNDNTAMGFVSLYSNTAGNDNTALGRSALFNNTTGNRNTAIGNGALSFNIYGHSNTAIGNDADVLVSYLSNATAIGYDAIVEGSNHVHIGNTQVTKIGGYVGWSNFSDGRYKKDIKENVAGLAFIKSLRPITYTINVTSLNQHHKIVRKQLLDTLSEAVNAKVKKGEDDAAKIVYSGFIAQEVEEAARKLNYEFSGVNKPQSNEGMYSLRYGDFVVPLVKAVQEQQQMIEDLKKENTEVKKQLLLLNEDIQFLKKAKNLKH